VGHRLEDHSSYTFAEKTSDCTLAEAISAGSRRRLPHYDWADRVEHIDERRRDPQNWLIGTRDVQMTAYDRPPRCRSRHRRSTSARSTRRTASGRYLYLSNNSTVSFAHSAVTLPDSPFTVSDRCPSTLEPQAVCQLQLAYQNAKTPAADAVTLSLDQGLTALVTGRSLPQPAANGASVNPNLSVSSTSFNFANAVVVTGYRRHADSDHGTRARLPCALSGTVRRLTDTTTALQR